MDITKASQSIHPERLMIMHKKDRKGDEVRRLLISGLTRQQLIELIKRNDSFYIGTSFTGCSDDQLIELAISVDNQARADRQIKKKNEKLARDNEGLMTNDNAQKT